MNGNLGKISIHRMGMNEANYGCTIRHVIVSIYTLIHDHPRHFINVDAFIRRFQNPLSNSFLLVSVLKKFGEGLGLDNPLGELYLEICWKCPLIFVCPFMQMGDVYASRTCKWSLQQGHVEFPLTIYTGTGTLAHRQRRFEMVANTCCSMSSSSVALKIMTKFTDHFPKH